MVRALLIHHIYQYSLCLMGRRGRMWEGGGGFSLPEIRMIRGQWSGIKI